MKTRSLSAGRTNDALHRLFRHAIFGLAAIGFAGAAFAVPPTFKVPIPPCPGSSSSPGDLTVVALYADANCDGVISIGEALEYVKACKAATQISGTLPIITASTPPCPEFEDLKAIAIANAMWRVFVRPDDFLVPDGKESPVGLEIASQCGSSPCDCVPCVTAGLPSPSCGSSLTGTGRDFQPTCSSALGVVGAIAQGTFGHSFNPALYPGVTIPPPVNPLASPPNDPTPPSSPVPGSGGNPCVVPSAPEQQPMPNGDGPVFCQAALKPAPGGGYINPCDGSAIPGSSFPTIGQGDITTCAAANPCAFPPITPEPPDNISEPVDPGPYCAGTTCMPDCSTIPCGHSDPEPADPGPYCAGMCDVPDAPREPIDTAPDHGMDPDGVANFPIDMKPKEKEPVYYCGDGESSAPVSNSSCQGPGATPARTGNPVDLVYGYKMEQETDLTLNLTGRDFHFVRNYSSNPADQGLGLVGVGWNSPLFEEMNVTGSGAAQQVILRGRRPNQFTRFWFDGTFFRPMGPSRNSVLVSTGSSGVFTYAEPGVGVTEYFNDGTANQGKIKVKRDEYGNEWNFAYRVFPGSTGHSSASRLFRIYFNGTDEATAEAFVEFGYYLGTNYSEPRNGRVARITAVRMILPSGASARQQYETHRVEYTYKNPQDPFSPDVGSNGDLIQVVKYSRVDRADADFATDPERAIGPGYPHRATLVQYRYHRLDCTTGEMVPIGVSAESSATIAGRDHQLKSVFRPQQLEYYAELLYRDNSVLGGKSFSVRDAAFRLMLLPDNAIAVKRGAESYNVDELASKLVGYEAQVGTDSGGRVAVQYIQSGCGCGGSAQAVKEEYTRTASSGSSGVWRSTLVTTSSRTGSTWSAFTRRWADSKQYSLAGSGSASVTTSSPFLLVYDVTKDDTGTGREWITEYLYDTVGRLTEIRTPAANAFGTTPRTYSFATTSTEPALSGTAPAGGLVRYMSYNPSDANDKRVFESGVRVYPGATDEKMLTIEYDSTHTHLPVRLKRFRSLAGGADNEEQTDISYEFYSGTGFGSHAIKSVKTTVEAEKVSENGPSSPNAYSSAQLFDNRGRPVFNIAADGTVTSFEYRASSASMDENSAGKAWRIRLNALASAISSTDYPNTYGLAAANSVPVLEFITEHDALGRVRRTTSPGPVSPGITSEFVYETCVIDSDPESRAGVRYAAYINFPDRLSDNTYAGPATISWVNAHDGALIARQYVPADSGSSSSDTLPINVVSTTGSGNDATSLDDYLTHRLGSGAALIGQKTVVFSLAGLAKTMTGWHDAGGALSRPSGDRSLTTTFEYDSLGRHTRTLSAQGTLQVDEFDVLGRIIKRKYGTTDTDLTTAAEYYYDYTSASGAGQGIGNGLLTVSRGYTGETTGGTRERRMQYDYRDRLVVVQNPAAPNSWYKYDNLDRVIASATYTSTPSASGGNSGRVSYGETAYSQRGLPYRTRVAIDPSLTDSSLTFLETHVWRDPVGRTLASWSPSSPGKVVSYDPLGRVANVYTTDRAGDVPPGTSGNYAAAISLTSDKVFSQAAFEYSSFGRLTLETQLVRRHDDTTTTGVLSASGTTPSAVATYRGYLYDHAARLIRTVNFGTNKAPSSTSLLGDTFSNGTVPSWSAVPSSIPDWNSSGWEDVIIGAVKYGPRGLVSDAIDPRGRVTRTLYDDLGRVIATIEHASTSSSGISWDNTNKRWTVTPTSTAADADRVTTYAHYHDNTDGWIVRQVAELASSAVQVTDYVHGVAKGTSATDSLIASGDWLREVRYPAESTGLPIASGSGYDAHRVAYTYNGLGEMRSATDQNNTRHNYTRDDLGRVLADSVVLPSSPPSTDDVVDTRVMEIDAAYNTAGLLTDVRSKGYNGGSSLVTVDHVHYAYDVLQRLTSVVQDPDSEIGASSGHADRTVGYAYDTAAIDLTGSSGGPGNRARLISMGYPTIPVPGNATPPSTTLMLGYDNAAPGTVLLATGVNQLTGLGLIDDDGTTVTAHDIAYYSYIGMGTIARVDLVQANVSLDRTVDAVGNRRYGSITSQAAASYPGLDRFGRVKRQAWVRSTYNWNGNTTTPAPNGREHVNLLYSYDKVGNPIGKQQAQQGAGFGGRWADRDWEYHYDGLDRLTLARKGVLTVPGVGFGGTFSGDPDTSGSGRPEIASGGSTPPENRALGAQAWELDLLGNWSSFKVNVLNDTSTGKPTAAFGGGGFTTSEVQGRSHNSANELTGITAPTPTVPTGAEFAAAPLLRPMTYTHDDTGNRVVSDGGTGTGAAPKHKYTYDAWNRLVQIDKWNTSGSAYQIIARYDYNGMHWRTRKLAYATPGGTTAQERVYIYNSAWQPIAEEIDDDYTVGGSSNVLDRVAQQVFGIRGVNDALYRREDLPVYVPEVTDPETGDPVSEAHTVQADGLFDKSIYQLSDAQGSIVSVISAQAIDYYDAGSAHTHWVYPVARTLETLEYDPYGRSKRTKLADYDHSGVVEGGEVTVYLGGWMAGSPSADQNDNGAIAIQDLFDYITDFFNPDATAIDGLSIGWIDNPYGYCGYYADAETLGINGDRNGFLYHCRHREYDPISGRWLQRDPAGFVDGCNLYQYVRGRSLRGIDTTGLVDDCMYDPELKEIAAKHEAEVRARNGGIVPPSDNPAVRAVELLGAGVGIALAGAVAFVVLPELVIGGTVAAGAEAVREAESGGGPELTVLEQVWETVTLRGGTVASGFSESQRSMLQQGLEDLENAGYNPAQLEELIYVEEMGGSKVAMSIDRGAALTPRVFESMDTLRSALEEELLHLQQGADGLRQVYDPETIDALEKAIDVIRKFPLP